MNYIVAAATDIGITKETNQDCYSVKVFNTPQGKMVFAILCDGMGGLEKGELASASLVHAYDRWTRERLPVLSNAPIEDAVIRKEWIDIATQYNEKIKMYGKSGAIHLGTTLTAILLTNNRYYIINIGDTRAYEIGAEVNVITSDQTVVAREMALGHLTPEEAATDPRRSKKLKTITVKTNKLKSSKVGKQAFKGIYAKAVIKVPKSKYKTYKSLFKKAGAGSKAVIKKN